MGGISLEGSVPECFFNPNLFWQKAFKANFSCLRCRFSQALHWSAVHFVNLSWTLCGCVRHVRHESIWTTHSNPCCRDTVFHRLTRGMQFCNFCNLPIALVSCLFWLTRSFMFVRLKLCDWHVLKKMESFRFGRFVFICCKKMYFLMTSWMSVLTVILCIWPHIHTIIQCKQMVQIQYRYYTGKNAEFVCWHCVAGVLICGTVVGYITLQ